MQIRLSEFVKNVGNAVASAADVASTAASTSFTVVRDSAERCGHSALEFGKSTGEAMGDTAQATSNLAARACDSISESAGKSLAAVKHGAGFVGEAAITGAKAAGTALGVAADSAGNALNALGVLVGDLNGDGKVDFKDAKIAAAKVRDVAGAVVAELGQLGKSALHSKLVQDAAACAVDGGVLASIIPIPIISTVASATAGAALGTYKSIEKR